MKQYQTQTNLVGTLRCACCVVAVWLLASAPASAIITNTITSADFSLGYGYVGVSTWNDSETGGANTPTTIGNFSFIPGVVSSHNSGSGPGFPSRVLSAGTFSGNGAGFTGTVNAVWLGGVPADTLTNPEINPNLRLQVNITSIRLRVLPYSGAGNPFGFVEITPGNGSSQPTVSGAISTDPSLFGSFTLLDWDPADFVLSGTNVTRTFVLTAPTVGELQIDGYEVLGNVQLLYNVPEPAAAALVAVAGVLLLRRRA
jgi:hypothetical protein